VCEWAWFYEFNPSEDEQVQRAVPIIVVSHNTQLSLSALTFPKVLQTPPPLPAFLKQSQEEAQHTWHVALKQQIGCFGC